MTTRYLIVAIAVALLALAGCTTEQASRKTAPAPTSQPSQGTQGGQGGGMSGGY